MSVVIERPNFFHGQYLGADDLQVLLDYARQTHARHALGAHTWGIVAGLDLVEQVSDAGDIEYYLLPGFAWDGYGRQIVVTCPLKLVPGLFDQAPTGLVDVWLGRVDQSTEAVRPGFEVCGSTDAYARVAESYVIAVGPRASPDERHDGVVLAGEKLTDPRDMQRHFVDDAEVVCDGSVPHQTFPRDDDGARWLVPVGKIAWEAGAGSTSGTFAALDDIGRQLSRSFRRLAGLVTEQVLAADGLIRLRRRTLPTDGSTTNDALCDAQALTIEDFDGQAPAELVWVEGNSRHTGDVRLFGTKLELRDGDGGEVGAPLYLQRRPEPNLLGGQDLEVHLGPDADAEGANRLAIGTTDDDGLLVPKVVVTDEAQVGVGTEDPASYHEQARDLVVARAEGMAGITIHSDPGESGSLYFARGSAAGENERGRISYDQTEDHLILGAATIDHVWLAAEGALGVGTDNHFGDPTRNKLVLFSSSSTEATLVSGMSSTGRLRFARTDGTDEVLSDGFVEYAHSAGEMRFGVREAQELSLRQDRIIFGDSGSDHLRLSHDSIGARSGGSGADLDINRLGGDITFHGGASSETRVVISAAGNVGIGGAASSQHGLYIRGGNPDLALDIIPDGSSDHAELEFRENGSMRSRLFYQHTDERTYLENDGDIALTVDGGDVGIGIGESAPTNRLHVRGDLAGAGSVVVNHVALIENISTSSNADVLALRVGDVTPGVDNNFITFFDGDSAIGRIEATPAGNGVRLRSGGADFAEYLPRLEAREPLEPGDVVGVFGGHISRRTTDADQLLVVTDRAIIAANAPDGDAAGHALVCFIGQVPVRMRGPAKAGDFAVASGAEDGAAVAVSPAVITARQALAVVARVWADDDRAEERRVPCAMTPAGLNAVTHVLARRLETP